MNRESLISNKMTRTVSHGSKASLPSRSSSRMAGSKSLFAIYPI